MDFISRGIWFLTKTHLFKNLFFPEKRENTRLVTTHEELQQYHADLESSIDFGTEIEEKVIGVFSEGQMQFEAGFEILRFDPYSIRFFYSDC